MNRPGQPQPRLSWLRTSLVVTTLVTGCAPSEKQTETIVSPDFTPREHSTLSLDAARDAHRRAELRRHLRMREAIEPGYVIRRSSEALDAGSMSIPQLYETGRLLFEHEYSFTDGLGSARRQYAGAKTGSPFRRVHLGRFGGPETTTCTSCHWRGGPAGAGGLADNSFFYGDGDRTDSADARNPPPLQGVGVVEALAHEMSLDLQAIRTRLTVEARETRTVATAPLIAKGVRFGTLSVEPDGGVNTAGVEGVDADLIVRPFGWKGTSATLREFVSESLQLHFGIQSDELVEAHRKNPSPESVGNGTNPDDPDGDGLTHEFTERQLTALVAFLAMQEVPVIRPPEPIYDAVPAAANLVAPTSTRFHREWVRGQQLFKTIGCADCHVEMLVLKNPIFRTRSAISGQLLEIDLSRQGEVPRIQYDTQLQGYPVWLFSDLKRHDLGQESASRHDDHGVPPQHYLTRRLWGLAKSPPYFHDGRAPWFDHAIAAHGGEASKSKNTFVGLSYEEKAALRVYLLSLTRHRRIIVP